MHIGYTINAMPQSARLAVTPIAVDTLLPSLIARRLAVHQTQ